MFPDFRFDISYRNESSLRTITLSTEIDALSPNREELCFRPDMGGVDEKLRQELLPVDYARVHHVLQDAINLRRTVTGLTSDCFRRGLTKFIEEAPIDRPVPENFNLEEAKVEIDRLRRAFDANKKHSEAHMHYREASSRATIIALQQMIETEREFSAFANAAVDYTHHEDVDVGAKVNESVLARGIKQTLSKARWRCEYCKFINGSTDQVCAVCKRAPNSASTSSPAPAATLESPKPEVSPKLLEGSLEGSPLNSARMLGNSVDDCKHQ
mmetsp:Transcript_22259/g.35321  ORF Transcript_22259/g.35321 Transcript_22259/m.35321 type:complete len:270 (+) Transcript_22259:1-810(+)